MTIRKGMPWGTNSGPLPDGSPVIDCDRDLAELVGRQCDGGLTVAPVVGLVGGSLWRTVGGPGARGRLYTAEAVWLPVDIGRAVLDGRVYWFAAHAVARRGRRWSVAMNADWWHHYQLGPKAHPNDGLLDTYEAELGWGELLKIRKRAVNGSHLPHPAVRERRLTHVRWQFDHTRPIWLDNHRIAQDIQEIEIEVVPDAATIII